MDSKQHKPKPYFPDKKTRSQMVSWFSPTILLKTLKDLVLSKIVGSQLDTRELQTVNENAQGQQAVQQRCRIANPYTLDATGDSFFFDFIADTGDGWDSTYTIASLLSRDYLVLEKDESTTRLPRGSFLLMGGDEIYPGPSEKAYEQRLVKPYKHAWDWLWLKQSKNNNNREIGTFIQLENKPDLYAIPGNHDWYDSLIAFRKVFCNIFRTKHIGQWQAKQSRSYFAIGLPHDWVILAFDFGLDQYKLDGLQHHYFYNIINSLSSKNRLIILAAEPLWVYGGVQNKKLKEAYDEIEQLITQVFSAKHETAPKIYLNLSGDTHNYQRYETLSEDGFQSCINQYAKTFDLKQKEKESLLSTSKNQHKRQHIVAGGGGAFLHPTHSISQQNMRVIPDQSYSLGEHSEAPHLCEIEIKDMYELKHRFPDKKTSKKLANKLLLKFLPNNIKLSFFIATLYLVLAWPMRGFLGSVLIRHEQLNDMIDSGLNFMTLLISALMIVGFTLWARSRPCFSLTLAGFMHGTLQVILLYGGYALVYFLVVNFWQSYDLQYGWFMFPIVRDILYFILIATLSPLLLALALWTYLNFFFANQNDLFGSGAVAHFKHLIRLEINPQGHLIIYPIATEKVTPYTMPENNEVSDQHLELLIKHNGSNWNKAPSSSPLKNSALQPEKLIYSLIEPPIVIKPTA